MNGPTPSLVVEFTKMNGAGNDFVVIDNRFFHFTDDELSGLARRLCRRRFGIGADGLLAFSVPGGEGAHFKMRYINADGSIGTMCGNGARCLARFARMAGIDADEMYFETDAGMLRALVPVDNSEPVRVYLGEARDFTGDLEMTSEEARQAGPLHYIWTGTEHVVCFVADVAATPVSSWGPAIRSDATLAPTGANVDFVELPSDGQARVRARTYEKGVEGETPACGTGAVAIALVSRLLGHVDQNRIAVEMPGGTLTVGFELSDDDVRNVYLEGPAEAVFRGTFEM